MRKLIYALCILFYAGGIYAADWYVSSAAGGGGDGSVGSPWTIVEAETNSGDGTVSGGDTVWVKADGTYTFTEDINIAADGAVDDVITWEGYTTTIGDGGRATFACGAYRVRTYDYNTVKNFNMSGTPQRVIVVDTYSKVINCKVENTSGNSSYVAIMPYGHGIYIINCEMINNSGYAMNDGAYLTRIIGCYIHDCNDGVKISYGGCLIYNNIFDTIAGEAIQQTTALNYNIINNTFYNCGEAYEATTGNNHYISNNIFASCTSGLVIGTASDLNYVDYNNWYDCTTTVTNATQGDNKQELDPSFSDAPNGNFAIGNDSLFAGFPQDIGGAGLTTSNPAIGAYQENDTGAEPENYILILGD